MFVPLIFDFVEFLELLVINLECDFFVWCKFCGWILKKWQCCSDGGGGGADADDADADDADADDDDDDDDDADADG